MENTITDQNEPLINLLAERVNTSRTDLIGRYHRVLQESLFTNRALVRPNIIKQVAADEVEAVLNFLKQSGFSGAGRGEKLHQAGFNVGAVLKLSQVTRQFLLESLEDHQVAYMLDTVDAYQQAVMEGFIQSMVEEHRIELEQTRNTLQRSDS
jgi:hypothetical protein